MLCVYQESHFLMPNTGQHNANNWHKAIMDVLTNGHHIESLQYLFKTDISPRMPESSLVRVRGLSLPEHCQPVEKKQNFTKGVQAAFRLRLCTTRRKKTTVNGKEKTIETFVSEKNDAFHGFLSQKLSSNGFALDSITEIQDTVVERVKREGRQFFSPRCDVTFLATITDEEAAAIAYVKGIGRNKVFGAGMMEVLDV